MTDRGGTERGPDPDPGRAVRSRKPGPTERGRGPDGRPRQQRPRDALGRPLPFGSEGVEPVPEEPLPPLEALALARELITEGRSFGAHEVLEARWKDCPEPERDFWQGLAQLCVAVTHHARGNDIGAERLFVRAENRLRSYGGETYGVDLAGALTWARARLAAAPDQ